MVLWGPRGERGMALGIVILSAIAFTAAAFAVLMMSWGRTQASEFQEDRLRARYAAEAGLVRAMQRLWNEATVPYPPGCAAGATGTDSLPFDTNGDGTDDATVMVTVTNCGPGNQHEVTAKVVYSSG